MHCEDTEYNEIRSIRNQVSFPGKDVLEVGCGDGRVATKYWNEPATIVAIDPDEKTMQFARQKPDFSPDYHTKVKFLVGEGEKLDFPSEVF